MAQQRVHRSTTRPDCRRLVSSECRHPWFSRFRPRLRPRSRCSDRPEFPLLTKRDCRRGRYTEIEVVREPLNRLGLELWTRGGKQRRRGKETGEESSKMAGKGF